MTTIALFHSALGVRHGVHDAAETLQRAGHDVRIVDQYDGRVFDDYNKASEFAGSLGYPALMQIAMDAVSDLPDGFVVAGFSNGGGVAEYIASQRDTAGVVMLSGALPLDVLGVASWPAGVPAQIHYATDDRFRDQAGIDAVAASVRSAGGEVEVFDYPGRGHLFTDETMAADYDPAAAALLWDRVLGFGPLATGWSTEQKVFQAGSGFGLRSATPRPR